MAAALLSVPSASACSTASVMEFRAPLVDRFTLNALNRKQLTAEDKRRLRGRVVWLAQKQEFSRQGFVGTIRGVLERTLGGRADV